MVEGERLPHAVLLKCAEVHGYYADLKQQPGMSTKRTGNNSGQVVGAWPTVGDV